MMAGPEALFGQHLRDVVGLLGQPAGAFEAEANALLGEHRPERVALVDAAKPLRTYWRGASAAS